MAYDDSPRWRQAEDPDSPGLVEPPHAAATEAYASAYDPAGHRGWPRTGEVPGYAEPAGDVRGYDGPSTAQAEYPGQYAPSAYRQPESATAPPAMFDPGQTAPEDDADDRRRAAVPRDRLAVHWVWELVLLLGVGGVAYRLWQADPDALRGDGLSSLLVFAACYGLLGLGAGLALRAGVPNLAIGPVATASMIYFAQRGADGLLGSTLVAIVAALVLGAAVAVVIIGLQVPGWAASIGAAVAVLVWIQLQPAQVELSSSFDPTSYATLLFMSVAALGALGGLAGTLPRVRRLIGQLRPSGDPADRRAGLSAGVITAGAVMLSMVFAVPAGVLLAAAAGGPVTSGAGLELTVIGLAVALVGGTSVFGRRGGVFGGTFAVAGLVLFHQYQQVSGWRISLLATAAVALVIGLGVSRLVESFGRPRAVAPADAHPDPGDPDQPGRFRYLDSLRESGSDGFPASDSWSSAQPAQPAPGQPDPWDDGRWPSR